MQSGRVATRILAAGLVAVGAVACSDTGTNPLAGTGQSVSLSFAGRTPTTSGVMAVAGVQGDTMVLGSGTDTLRITSAEVVLKKIELKRVGTSASCDSTLDESACEEFTIGTQLVSLPLLPGAQTALTVPVDSGSYAAVEFKIHKPGSDSADLAFKAANPDFAAISIRVRGTFNGTPFTYTSTLDAEQEYAFVPPLVVDASGTASNLTIRLDLATWFRNAGSGTLIDPATANVGGVNEGVVKENIKNSVKAFEDRNHDGDERDG